MADILIHMEMPKYTTKAEFGIDADGNPLCMVYHEDGTEPDIYDVVPLPEGHGRLIDADKLDYTMLYKENWMRGTGVEAPAIWKSDIDAADTIVPAEGGSEDG